MFNEVKVPEQKPQTSLLVIEEVQSGKTEDKTLTEDPLGPHGQLYNEYFEPEEYEPCAKMIRQKEKDIKAVQDDKDFKKKWNEIPPSPLSKEIKDTAQPRKETLSDHVVPTPSVPANHKWLYELLHQKNPPLQSYPRNLHSRMNFVNSSNFPHKSRSNARNWIRKMLPELTVAQNTISYRNSNNPICSLPSIFFSTGAMTSSQKRSCRVSSNDSGILTIIGCYLRFVVYVLRHLMSLLKPGNRTGRI